MSRDIGENRRVHREEPKKSAPEPPKPAPGKAAERINKGPAEEQRHLQTLNHSQKHFDNAGDGGDRDGVIGKKDLEAVASGKSKSTDEERDAAKYFLQHADHLRALDDGADGDKQGDGKISQDDLDARLTQADKDVADSLPADQRKQLEGQRARAQSDSLDSLSKDFKVFSKDDRVTRDTLQAAADNGQLSSAQRDTARYFLDNPERLQALDKADDKKGDKDGKIATGDIKAAQVDAFNELRTHPDEKRTAAIEKQQATKWETVEDVRKNLADNPDLSTYSKDQLLAADILAQKDPELAKQLQKTTSSYLDERTRNVDQIPEDPAFQRVVYDQVVQSKDKSVEGTQDHLKAMLQDKLRATAGQRLDGKNGDDEAKQAVNDFIEKDLQPVAERNPALSGYLEGETKSLVESSSFQDDVKKVAEKDDNFLTKGIHWVGENLGGLVGKAVSFSTNFGALGVAKLGFDVLGMDGAEKFVSNIQGGIGRSGETLVTGLTDLAGGLTEHPIETGKGLTDLGLNFGPLSPLNDLKQMVVDGKSPEEINQHKTDLAKGLWNSFTADYKKTSEQYGAEGATAHVVSDVLLAIASGGTSAEAEGGIKGASLLGKLKSFKTIESLSEWAKAGKTGQALDVLSELRAAMGTAEFANLSPGLQKVIESQLSSLESAATTQAPLDNSKLPVVTG